MGTNSFNFGTDSWHVYVPDQSKYFILHVTTYCKIPNYEKSPGTQPGKSSPDYSSYAVPINLKMITFRFDYYLPLIA